MPRLWNETIDAHRRAVREATLDAAARLVAERGLAGVTMSEIAEATGIGRATLYKYFPDVDAILFGWHERQVARHLEHLAKVRDGTNDPAQRLPAVLEAYGSIQQKHPTSEIAALLHRGDHMARAEHHLAALVRDLIVEGVHAGEIRNDTAPEELARFCLHALTAARSARSKATVRRLVKLTLAGLQPPRRRR